MNTCGGRELRSAAYLILENQQKRSLVSIKLTSHRKSLLIGAFMLLSLGVAKAKSVVADEWIEAPVVEESLLHEAVMDGDLVRAKSGLGAFVVRLVVYHSDRNPTTCTGIIVASDIIMTAGHCFKRATTKVKVQFGLGGDEGFRKEVFSEKFAYRYHGPEEPPSASQTVGDYLAYDLAAHTKFRQALAQQKDLDVHVNNPNAVIDIGVVRIRGLPRRFTPAPMYSGPQPLFRSDLMILGYGINAREAKLRDRRLRFGELMLIGKVVGNGLTMGWQYATKYEGGKHSNCGGDSGGPILAPIGQSWGVIGMHLSGNNNCANDGWGMNLSFWGHELGLLIQQVRQMRNT